MSTVDNWWEAPDDEPESGLTAWLEGDIELSNNAVIQALRELSPLEYDRLRKEAAQRLGCRLSTLDDEMKQQRGDEEPASTLFEEVEPWPEPVGGASLLSEIRYVLQTYLAFSEEDATTCALWVMHTYTHDAAEASPILSFTSPEKRCGKTTALSLLSALVHRPAGGSSFTRASIYRVVEKYCPTLLIDEADSTVFKQGSDSELRGIINSGHTRRMAYVWVCVGDEHEPTQFSTWAAKAIACIGTLSDTIADRSIEIKMRRKTQADDVERYRDRLFEKLASLRCKCLRWADDNLVGIRLAEPDIPVQLSDRAADSWAPLLAIADAAGGDWPKTARQAALRLSDMGAFDNSTVRSELLRDLHSIFEEAGNPTVLSTADLLASLHKMDERPWPTYHRGKELSARGLGSLLKPFGIHSDTIRFGTTTAKGYHRSAFDDAFSRYLPESPVTTVTNDNNGQSDLETLFSANRASVTNKETVTDKYDRNQPEWAGNGNVTHVTDNSRVCGRKGVDADDRNTAMMRREDPF